eukprot:620757_1
MGVCYSFNIREVDWCYDDGYTFQKSRQTCGYPKAFNANKLSDLESMSIECFVSEAMDVSDDKTYFEWKVNHHWMQRWKNAEYKQWFRSPMFNAIGVKWRLEIAPNGWSTNGRASLDIRCVSIESNEKEITFSHFIDIESMNHCQTNFNGNKIKKGEYVAFDSPFNWNDIQNQPEITIRIKIWKTGSVEEKEAQLLLNIYSNKMKKLHKEYSDQISSLERANKALTMSDLEKEQRKEIEHLRQSVAMREIKTFGVVEEVVIDKEIIEKQKSLDGQMRLDEERLNEWKLDSQKIENELKSEEKEKEFDDANETSQHLLNRFVECKTLCDKQQMRMESVVAYCTELNKIKKVLKNERKQCTEMVHKMDKDCQDLNAKHKTLQAKRSKLQIQWRVALEAMNKCIDEENKTNDAKCCAQNQYNLSDLEAQQWNVSRTKCIQLIKKYRLFDAQN